MAAMGHHPYSTIFIKTFPNKFSVLFFANIKRTFIRLPNILINFPVHAWIDQFCSNN